MSEPLSTDLDFVTNRIAGQPQKGMYLYFVGGSGVPLHGLHLLILWLQYSPTKVALVLYPWHRRCGGDGALCPSASGISLVLRAVRWEPGTASDLRRY